MANIKVTVTHPIADGTKLKFRTPCESTKVDGLIVKAPIKGGIGNAVKTFCFVDAHGTELSGVGNVFTSDVLIEVMLDVTKGRAYIKNADTNSYIESIKETLARFEEERKEIYAEAFTIIDECGKATKSANEAANTLKLSADEIRSGGFVEALKELNAGHNFLFWVGTEEEYGIATSNNSIPPNTFCIITDETTEDGFLVEMEELTRAANTSTEVSNSALEASNSAIEASNNATEVSNDANGKIDGLIAEMKGLYFDDNISTFGWYANTFSRQNPLECEAFIGVMPYGSVVVFDNVQKDNDGLVVTLTATVGFASYLVEINYIPGEGAYKFNDYGAGFSHIVGKKGGAG
jgi:hypothetical protein